MAGPQDVRGAARAAPGLLRQLRLAFLRPRATGCWRGCAAFPGSADAADIAALFDRQFTAENVAVEVRLPRCAAVARLRAALWLGLAAEARRELARYDRRGTALVRLPDAAGRKRSPPASASSCRKRPTRCASAPTSTPPSPSRWRCDYAETSATPRCARSCATRRACWYGGDADCQAWEPGGDDFLSPALIEAECMRRVLPARPNSRPGSIASCPTSRQRQPAALFTPATVSDRSDGKIAHLDGLNLSRAWCWRSLASALAAGRSRRARVLGPPTNTWRQPARMWPANTWANTGSPASPSWRFREAADGKMSRGQRPPALLQSTPGMSRDRAGSEAS